MNTYLKKRKKLKILAAAVLLVCVSIAGYAGYYIRTPQYSLGLIETAVNERDWYGFSAHVDTDKVMGTAFDGTVEFAVEQKQDEMIKAFADPFIQSFRSVVVGEMTAGVKRYVETGNFNGNDADNQKPPTAPEEGLKAQVNFKHLVYKGITSVETQGDTAVVGLKLVDTQLDKELLLDVKMKKLPDGTWQIMEITNFKDFLATQHKARQHKLNVLNKPLQEKINAAVGMGVVTAALVPGDSVGLSQNLVMTIPMAVRTTKPVMAVTGMLMVGDKTGQLLFMKQFEEPLNGAFNRDVPITITEPLNPFSPSRSSIAAMNPAELKISSAITGITYMDGTSVVLLKTLPDS